MVNLGDGSQCKENKKEYFCDVKRNFLKKNKQTDARFRRNRDYIYKHQSKMRKNTRFKKWMAAAMSSIITLLGFSSCQEEGADDVPCMYGMPYSHFELKGKVTDTDGQFVENAEISLKSKYEGGDLNGQYKPVYTVVDMTADTKPNHMVKTDSKGDYHLGGSVFFKTVRVICTPAKDSGLEADSTEITVTFEKDPNVKDDGWYIGSYQGTLDFELKKK